MRLVVSGYTYIFEIILILIRLGNFTNFERFFVLGSLWLHTYLQLVLFFVFLKTFCQILEVDWLHYSLGLFFFNFVILFGPSCMD